MARARTARRDGHQKINLRGQRCCIGVVLEAGLGLFGARGVSDGHVKGGGAPRNGLADAAQADDAHARARHLAAQRHGALRPAALPHMLVGLRHQAGHRQDQRHGQVGHVIGQHAGGVRHRHTLADGGRHVNAVITHAKHRQHLELRQLRDQTAGNNRLATRCQTHNAGRQRSQRLGVALRLVGVDVVHSTQGLQVQRVDLGHGQNIEFGHRNS